MKKRTLAIALVISAGLAMAACESDGSYYEGGYHHGYNRARLAYYDGYYDNYYGPIYGGYWGPNDVFFYQTRRGGPWLNDGSRHFRRDRFDGGVSFHIRDSR